MRRGFCNLAAVALGVVLGAGCVPDFKPASQLDETPQVLAVRAEPPEVIPGQTVHLDALVHFPGGAPDYLWLVCIPSPADTMDTCVSNRLGEGGVLLPLCASSPGAPLCYASREATATYTVPPDLPLDADGKATVFVELVVGDDVDSDDCVQAYRDLNPPERCLVAFKRLAVSVEPIVVNPELLILNVDGWPVLGSVTSVDPWGLQGEDLAVKLTVQVDSGVMGDLFYNHGVSEMHFPVAWYSDCGELDEDRTSVDCEPQSATCTNIPFCDPSSVTWKPKTSGECTVYVTLRDGRGGVDWLTQRFTVGYAQYQ